MLRQTMSTVSAAVVMVDEKPVIEVRIAKAGIAAVQHEPLWCRSFPRRASPVS